MEDDTSDVLLKDLPEEFLGEMQSTFQPYSVAIARTRNGAASTFTPLGTGVLVRRGSRFGILTAHHCLHACQPEVEIGRKDGDSLMLILCRGRQVVLESFEVTEIPLAKPVADEFGPDLTFIEILAPERLGTIQAIGSFWNLDVESGEVLKNFSKPGVPLASVGFPGVDYKTQISGNDVHHCVCNMTYANVIGEDSITEKGDWDYLELNCTYSSSNNLPPTFAGVSGGPVWAFELRFSRSKKTYSVGAFALVGIKFYQTAKVGDQRRLRAHFVKSIYDTAWTHLEKPNEGGKAA